MSSTVMLKSVCLLDARGQKFQSELYKHSNLFALLYFTLSIHVFFSIYLLSYISIYESMYFFFNLFAFLFLSFLYAT